MSYEWLNPPKTWHVDDNTKTITVQTDEKTDFWRKTHYGFIRDNGHFYSETMTGNFTCEVLVRGEYRDLYDQAGIMVRLDEENWLKCGIEFVDSKQYASVVVTRDGFSDWSIIPMKDNLTALWLRVKRSKEALHIEYDDQGDKNYKMMRLTYLPECEKTQVGIMCASPDGKGFKACFEHLNIEKN
ncbi:unnamed protein product [Didymodactylos carnosus]|uniref:DUF1349 domain-containing protein n=1 Tax=Didymodactylos carnosus TaxID=1234261 RepID=A0A8S2IVQ7_9BILA|nr:unnamed protein product [Didymodactylos carnosus]CAF3772190.1 unnamed protein product [Didymodactylos carnosus]